MDVDGIVYAVDDDAKVLKSVQAVLASAGFDVHAYTAPAEFLKQANLEATGCLVTDLKMPLLNGMELQSRLVNSDSTLGIVFVTGYASVSKTVQIMQNGAITLLEKPYDPERLLRAVVQAIDISRKLVENKRQRRDASSRLALLSMEEYQVLECASTGMPNKAISRTLCVSSRTVDRRRQAAFRKLQISSLAEFAVIRAHTNSAESGNSQQFQTRTV